MAITNNDVKLFESQRLTDEEDGGGRVTGREVIDGNVNNLFQDISRIDRTVGDVALRKAFIGIITDNNDTCLGSHLILTEPPKDKKTSVFYYSIPTVRPMNALMPGTGSRAMWCRASGPPGSWWGIS